MIDDYNSDSVDYSAYGSSSGELEGSDSSPSSEEDSSDDASERNCNGGQVPSQSKLVHKYHFTP